jgi:hypothetical protein
MCDTVVVESAYRREIAVAIRHNEFQPDCLTVTLTIRTYRGDELIRLFIREHATDDNLQSLKRLLARVTRDVRVCDVDEHRPDDQTLVPSGICWDIQVPSIRQQFPSES